MREDAGGKRYVTGEEEKRKKGGGENKLFMLVYVQHLSSMSVKTSFISDELFTVNVTYAAQIDGRLLAICCPPNYKTRLKTMPITKRTTIIIIIHYYIRERVSEFGEIRVYFFRPCLYSSTSNVFNFYTRNKPESSIGCRREEK